MNKIVSYAFLLIGATFALLAAPSEVETLMFAFDSESLVETTAEVTTNYTQKHQKGPDTQKVEYAFWVDGKKVHGDNQLTRLTDRPLEVEQLVHSGPEVDTIKVYYRADDPSVSAIHREVGYGVPIAILVVTGLCLVLGIEGVLARPPERRARHT